VTDPESRIRVAIVDDHRMLLGALTEWIRSAQDIDMVAAVASWPELLTHPAFPVDVVLLDLDLKDNIPISLSPTSCARPSAPARSATSSRARTRA
jgi:DNA-binding NarL/FixJ family response regulator